MAEVVAPELKRDSTMEVTAKEGEAFLDSEGGVKEDAKTRAQQKKLEELEEDSPSKMKRTTTMAATAQEGSDILGDAELGKTRSETAAGKPKEENGDSKVENGENGETEDDEKPAITREGTMAATAEEGAKFLENAGHLTDGGTRGEAAAVKAAIEESETKDENGESKDEEKPDLKRKGPDAEIVEKEESPKKQKTSNGSSHTEEVTAEN